MKTSPLRIGIGCGLSGVVRIADPRTSSTKFTPRSPGELSPHGALASKRVKLAVRTREPMRILAKGSIASNYLDDQCIKIDE
ncbi:hypothetical protein D3C71_1887840 [compost metagenome]